MDGFEMGDSVNENDLRDCFAMFTLCGIVMRGIGDDVIEEVAQNAYKMADAMLLSLIHI